MVVTSISAKNYFRFQNDKQGNMCVDICKVYIECPKKMSPYTNYSSFVKRALLYLWEFKIVSKPNSNTKMLNYKLITNSSKNALE